MKWLISFLVVIFLVLQYRLWFSYGGQIDVRRIQEKVENQREENQRLKERNEALSAEVRDLKQGVEAIEERARREMGMIKENETFYQIIDSSKTNETGTSNQDVSD
jgi:cell division protein FtsB